VTKFSIVSQCQFVFTLEWKFAMHLNLLKMVQRGTLRCNAALKWDVTDQIRIHCN